MATDLPVDVRTIAAGKATWGTRLYSLLTFLGLGVVFVCYLALLFFLAVVAGLALGAVTIMVGSYEWVTNLFKPRV